MRTSPRRISKSSFDAPLLMNRQLTGAPAPGKTALVHPMRETLRIDEAASRYAELGPR